MIVSVKLVLFSLQERAAHLNTILHGIVDCRHTIYFIIEAILRSMFRQDSWEYPLASTGTVRLKGGKEV